MTDNVEDHLQKSRPPFQRVCSLRYSADPCRDEVDSTRGAQLYTIV